AARKYLPSSASAGTVSLPDQLPSAPTANTAKAVSVFWSMSRWLNSRTSTSGLGAPWGGTHGVTELTAITVRTGPEAGWRSNTPNSGPGVVVVGATVVGGAVVVVGATVVGGAVVVVSSWASAAWSRPSW